MNCFAPHRLLRKVIWLPLDSELNKLSKYVWLDHKLQSKNKEISGQTQIAFLLNAQCLQVLWLLNFQFRSFHLLQIVPKLTQKYDIPIIRRGFEQALNLCAYCLWFKKFWYWKRKSNTDCVSFVAEYSYSDHRFIGLWLFGMYTDLL